MSNTFEDAIQPLLAAYDALEAEIKEKETQLAGLRDKRNRLKTAVRAVAPERLPEAAKPKARASNTRFGKGALAAVNEFLHNNINGGEFSTRSLLDDPTYGGPQQSTLSAILRHLHEAGSLRLVRQGRGGERFYEVIR